MLLYRSVAKLSERAGVKNRHTTVLLYRSVAKLSERAGVLNSLNSNSAYVYKFCPKLVVSDSF